MKQPHYIGWGKDATCNIENGSVKIKSNRSVYKNSTLVDKVVSHGNWVNKSDTTIHAYQN